MTINSGALDEIVHRQGIGHTHRAHSDEQVGKIVHTQICLLYGAGCGADQPRLYGRYCESMGRSVVAGGSQEMHTRECKERGYTGLAYRRERRGAQSLGSQLLKVLNVVTVWRKCVCSASVGSAWSGESPGVTLLRDGDLWMRSGRVGYVGIDMMWFGNYSGLWDENVDCRYVGVLATSGEEEVTRHVRYGYLEVSRCSRSGMRWIYKISLGGLQRERDDDIDRGDRGRLFTDGLLCTENVSALRERRSGDIGIGHLLDKEGTLGGGSNLCKLSVVEIHDIVHEGVQRRPLEHEDTYTLTIVHIGRGVTPVEWNKRRCEYQTGLMSRELRGTGIVDVVRQTDDIMFLWMRRRHYQMLDVGRVLVSVDTIEREYYLFLLA
ncbi:hypothetical protein Tco_0228108 [Tanacetum coccineum]